jgi:hypothetical protein
VPDSSDTTFDTSIPVLNEILVPGKPAHARSTHGAEAAPGEAVDLAEAVGESAVEPAIERAAEPAIESATRPATESATEPAAELAAEREAESAHEPEPEPFTEPPEQSNAEPADGVTIHAVTPAQVNAFTLPEPLVPFELASAPELDVPPEPALVDPFEPSSAFHFSRAPAAPAPAPNLDADVLAERLRGRFASYLTGEGRAVIEARCRDALQDHTTWLINQITREVALTLETEMTGWVREAVNEEIARRSSGH